MGMSRRQWRMGQGAQLHAHHNARACVSAEGYSENSGSAGSRFLCSWLLGRYVMAVGCSPRLRASAKRCSSCCHCFLYDSHALMLACRRCVPATQLDAIACNDSKTTCAQWSHGQHVLQLDAQMQV